MCHYLWIYQPADLIGRNDRLESASAFYEDLVLGLSGKTSDTRDVKSMADAGDPLCQLVIQKLLYDTVKNIGMFAAVMNGVDLIVITGGVGENNAWYRYGVCKHLDYLGLRFDCEANEKAHGDAVISRPDSPVKAASITTDEELVIARDTMHIVKNLA